MMRIGIFGYGNLGRGAATAAMAAADMELCGIFTRRDPAALCGVPDGVPVYAADSAAAHRGAFDALILCGGSADDLPWQTPLLARDFSVVDSFDTHAKIPAHFAAVDAAARAGGKVALISAGWYPGLFSLMRLYAEAALPRGKTYTFWGAGVSEGHSDAARRVPGVADARAYTLPVVDALTAVRKGETPPLSPRAMHRRVCYVVPMPDADTDAVAHAICTMPAYFADYETEVHFITAEEMARDHAALPHGGCVLRNGDAGGDCGMEFSLRLASNPAFTGGVLVACARAVCRAAARGEIGCRTLFDIPPADLLPNSVRARETLL